MKYRVLNLPIYTPKKAQLMIQRFFPMVEDIIKELEDLNSLQIDLESASSVAEVSATTIARLRSVFDEKCQGIQENLKKMQKMGMFFREHPMKTGVFFVDLLGLRNSKLTWICWRFGESDVIYYHHWQQDCSKRIRLDVDDASSWNDDLDGLTFFVTA